MTKTTTIGELSAKTGLDPKTLRKALADLKPRQDGPRNLYPAEAALTAVDRYLSAKAEQSGSDERKQNWRLRNQKLQIEIDQLRGSLYSKEHVDSFHHALLAIQRATLLTVFNGLPVTLAGLDVAAIRGELDATFNKYMDGCRRGLESWEYKSKATDEKT